jgi:hypothetical protein
MAGLLAKPGQNENENDPNEPNGSNDPNDLR